MKEQLSLRNELASGSPSHDPAPNFLGHLQERLGVDDQGAAEWLELLLATYEPGPAALAQSLAQGEAILPQALAH